jgi:hypothetical protein
MTSIWARSGLVASAKTARAAAPTAWARAARLLPLALAAGLLVTVSDVAGLGAASPQGREPPRSRVRSRSSERAPRIVPVLTTVTDQQGRLVPSLEEGGLHRPRQRQARRTGGVLNETQPFTAVVMLDTSASMTASLDR